MEHEILLGLTTTPASDWRGKVEEMKKFGIKRIALFPTFLPIHKRKKLYALLDEIEGLVIPHVHLRSDDMEAWELEMFEEKYKTEVFNIHQNAINVKVFAKYKHKIYIENQHQPLNPEFFKGYAGLCVDFSHWEDAKRMLNKRVLRSLLPLVESLPIGCCHVSAVVGKWNPFAFYFKWSRHYMKNLSQLDYIGQYTQYLPKYISIELENTFKRQLDAKAYLEKIINGK